MKRDCGKQAYRPPWQTQTTCKVAARPGMMLIDVMAALMLLAVVGLISARLFYTTFHLQHALEEGHQTRSQYDHIMSALTRDVWGAATLKISQSGDLEIIQPEGVIAWRLDASAQQLTRTAGSTITHWPGLLRPVQFEPLPAGLRVSWSDPAGQPATTVTLPSQLLLAKEKS